MWTLSLILVVAALVITILAGIGKAPLWVSVLLLALVHLLTALPVR